MTGNGAYANTPKPIKFKFVTKLESQLNEMRQENRCCDVRFEIDGKIFPCHRLVLIAMSQYFDTMFNGHFKESSSDIISLKEIDAETFEEILNAIYTGNIGLLPSNAYIFLKASHLLLLDAVENACVSFILENIKRVHYLIEICVFSKNISRNMLYSACIFTISKYLYNYGRTDSFAQIPIDCFKEILSKWRPKIDEEEFTFRLISKWSKENNASFKEIQELLLSSRLHITTFMNPTLMTLCIESFNNSCVEVENQICEKMDLDFQFDFKVYLNVVDVETGEKGWSVLKTNENFDTYVLSTFHSTYSSYKKVCTVGSKIYCLEYFGGVNKRNVFYCYDENNAEISLPTPQQLLKGFQMSTSETSIYIMQFENEEFIVWVYYINFKSWKNLFVVDDFREFDTVFTYTFLNGSFYVIAQKGCVTSLFCIGRHFSNVEKVINWDSDPICKGYILYGFDNNKLALYNLYWDISYVEVFDVSTSQFVEGFQKCDLKFKRDKFHCIYHNNSIFVLENNRTIVNEKLDLETHTWSELPALPKRVIFVDSKVLATGDILGLDLEVMKN